jgi:hypothetical protein
MGVDGLRYALVALYPGSDPLYWNAVLGGRGGGPPGFVLRTIQTAASRCNDCAIPAHWEYTAGITRLHHYMLAKGKLLK